ncbi:DNA alkylation repair protein [Gorillibacterium sp. CAU 1737]|uniref:DNA alkylation repair protein n=1 Tax=Gorillibacterium sp. CAU 1737 TaxID=3140362 RepID=UPI0032613B19
MSDAMKDIYTPAFIQGFGKQVHTAYPSFSVDAFTADVFAPPWDELPLRARMHRIAEQLKAHLPGPYEEALTVLISLEEACTGFPYLFFPDFVATYGRSEEHWELSMHALERFTQRSSAEFAIRPFLLQDPERVMSRMQQWAIHPNEHVRRLASEGCRPRLPWGVSLPLFKKDPAPVLCVLEHLKADPSLYVRKSVANNLNDIAKDHPALVLSVAKEWKGQHPHTNWIIRHGCRSLIRKAIPEALALFGYTETTPGESLVRNASLTVQPEQLHIGDRCELHYFLNLNKADAVQMRLEYGIDFIKHNGKPSRKLFLLSDRTAAGDAHVSGKRAHSFADLTTRKHYPGLHRIVLLLNGQEIAHTQLTLLKP